MVKLRLKRTGSKYRASYRLVAADARAPRDGKFIEEIGYYNPHSKVLKINVETRDAWLAKGAVPTDTVKNLFTKYASLVSTANAQGEVTLKAKAKKAKVEEPAIVAEETTVEETASEE